MPKVKGMGTPLTYKLVVTFAVPMVVFRPLITAAWGVATTPVEAVCVLMAFAMAMALALGLLDFTSVLGMLTVSGVLLDAGIGMASPEPFAIFKSEAPKTIGVPPAATMSRALLMKVG